MTSVFDGEGGVVEPKKRGRFLVMEQASMPKVRGHLARAAGVGGLCQLA
jgi:hypothetical protein